MEEAGKTPVVETEETGFHLVGFVDLETAQNVFKIFKNELLQKIDESNAVLQFDIFYMEERYIFIKCATKATRDWVLKTNSDFEREHVCKVNFREYNFSPDGRAVRFFLPDYSGSFSDFKKKLLKQNPGLDASKWRCLCMSNDRVRNTVTEHCQLILDHSSAKYLIEHGWELYFGLRKIQAEEPKYNIHFEVDGRQWIPREVRLMKQARSDEEFANTYCCAML